MKEMRVAYRHVRRISTGQVSDPWREIATPPSLFSGGVSNWLDYKKQMYASHLATTRASMIIMKNVSDSIDISSTIVFIDTTLVLFSSPLTILVMHY